MCPAHGDVHEWTAHPLVRIAGAMFCAAAALGATVAFLPSLVGEARAAHLAIAGVAGTIGLALLLRRSALSELHRLRGERDRLRSLLDSELRHRAEQETLYRSLVANIPGVAYRCEASPGRPTLHIGAGVAELTGYPVDAFERRELVFGELVHPDDLPVIEAVARRAIEAGEPCQTRYRIRRADGAIRWIDDWCRPLHLDGRLVLDGVLFDVTEPTEAQLDAEKADAEYRRLIESLPIVIYLDALESSAPTSFVSPQVVSLLGYTQEEWIADPQLWIELLHPDDRERAVAENDRHNRTGHPFRMEYRLRGRDGAYRWVRDEAAIELDDDGNPVASRGYLLDITEQKRLEQQLLHQAFHDPLTGLANRALLLDRVEHALLRRRSSPLALLYVDIDDLKAVNDSQGHAAGDALLQVVAERIGRRVRDGDTAARLGGDEFVVLLEEAGEEGATRVADAIVGALREPIDVAGATFSVSASVGLALAGPDDDCERLLQHADLAMYEAKRLGKGNVRVWSETLDVRANDRFDLRVGLDQALQDGELELFFQPIVALEGGSVAGLEALLRWNHPERGRLLPGQFLSAVHTSELAVRIGRWAVDEALAGITKIRRTVGRPDLFVAVNISPHELDQPDLSEIVLGALASYRLPSQSLVLEITEGTIVADLDGASTRLAPLRHAGVRVAIDDFGTGFSSLNYLGRLPADMLKIPKQFVDALPVDDRTAQVVAKVIDLCDGLALDVVAEGIELAEQAATLEAMGCALGQGFHFASPCSLGEIMALLAPGAPRVVRPRPRRGVGSPGAPNGSILGAID